MSDLSNVLTQEQRDIRRGMYFIVFVLCAVLVNLCMVIAFCIKYPLLGKFVASFCVSAALLLIGFEVGRRFEMNNGGFINVK